MLDEDSPTFFEHESYLMGPQSYEGLPDCYILLL